jgi:predicted membrane GTPase involved in stress response
MRRQRRLLSRTRANTGRQPSLGRLARAIENVTEALPTLEQAIASIQDDELLEVTPRSIRLRERYLDPYERKKASRAAA